MLGVNLALNINFNFDIQKKLDVSVRFPYGVIQFIVL